MTQRTKENFENMMSQYASERDFVWNYDSDRYQSLLYHFKFQYTTQQQEIMSYSYFLVNLIK